VDFLVTYPSLAGTNTRHRGISANTVGNIGIQATTYPVTDDWMHYFAASVTEAKRRNSEGSKKGIASFEPILRNRRT
jgi:hypothetical protein